MAFLFLHVKKNKIV
ncbi:hypothetical protein AMTRI_Chr03g45700 [Amborella trichopoda]